MNKLFGFNVASAAMLTLASVATATAGTSTTTFQVTATVSAACSVTATDLTFPAYVTTSVTATTGTSAVSANCTLTTPYDLGLSAGTGTGGTVLVRKMTSGSNLLSYNLAQDAAFVTNWGNTVGTDTVHLVGTGIAVPTTVYGRIPTLQNVATGSYADTVTATVTF